MSFHQNTYEQTAYVSTDFKVDDVQVMSRKMLDSDGEERNVEVGTIAGYGGVFNNTDLQDDIIEPGAFFDFTDKNARGALRVKMFLDHDRTRRPGVWTSLSQDDRGLLAKGEFNMNTTLGRETYEEVKSGSLDSMSVGFRIPKGGAYYDKPASDDDVFGTRHITKAKLFEISLVPIPANPQAKIDTVKNLDFDTISERELEFEIANRLGMSRRQTKSLLKLGYKGLELRNLDVQDAEEIASKVPSDEQDAEGRAQKLAADHMIAMALELRRMREANHSDPVMKGLLAR